MTKREKENLKENRKERVIIMEQLWHNLDALNLYEIPKDESLAQLWELHDLIIDRIKTEENYGK